MTASLRVAAAVAIVALAAADLIAASTTHCTLAAAQRSVLTIDDLDRLPSRPRVHVRTFTALEASPASSAGARAPSARVVTLRGTAFASDGPAVLVFTAVGNARASAPVVAGQFALALPAAAVADGRDVDIGVVPETLDGFEVARVEPGDGSREPRR